MKNSFMSYNRTFYFKSGVLIIAFIFQEAWSSMIISDLYPDPTFQEITDPDPDGTKVSDGGGSGFAYTAS